MLRLTTTNNPGGVTIRAEGELVAEWVELLADTCEGLRENGSDLRLDLSGLTYVDSQGVKRLRLLEGAGIPLLHCPPLIRTMLTED
jgi:anti-anti-sigma regulatory factor